MRIAAVAFVVLTACASAEPPAAPKDPIAQPPPTTKDDIATPAPDVGDAIATTGSTEVVRTCTVDADCAVKNVGNCCGYYPACVNKDSPTFPERVKAECEAKGLMSTCGFAEPSGCQCVDGLCAATGTAVTHGEVR